MTSPSSSSSTLRQKLTEQEYLELVFENGQILAKSQRSNSFSLQNQRTKSIIDLYETEYNEDFKKSIHGDTNMLMNQTLKGCSSNKIVVDYDKCKDLEFIPPDEQSSVAERSITQESEGSMNLSSLDDTRAQTLVKRRRSKELHNSSEIKQQNDINKKMRTLQDLIPNSHKEDNESLLDEAINYMTTLQHQVQMMTMGNRFVIPAMMLPLGSHYSQIGMQIDLPQTQFLPAPLLRAGLPWISNSAEMLRFFNQPGLMPMQNSALFAPMENCFPQSVPPSCASLPNQVSNSTYLSNLDDARTNGGKQ